MTYEARTAGTNEEVRQAVERYWRFLSPFIGLVPRGVLGAIRQRAETSQ